MAENPCPIRGLIVFFLHSFCRLHSENSWLKPHFTMPEKDDGISVWNSVTEPGPKVNTSVEEVQRPPTPEGPTDSHVLSQVEQDEKGLIQKAGETPEITDFGWNNLTDHDEPLIHGLSNEDLWILIRRFDKVSLCDRNVHCKQNGF